MQTRHAASLQKDMAKFDDKYRIESARAEWHGYDGGMYFITICTEGRKHYFGHIDESGMCLSPLGVVVDENIRHIADHYPYAEIPLYTVMPNHLHFLLSVATQQDRAVANVVGGLKSAVTREAHRRGEPFGWQSRFYDHIVRGIDERSMIAEYITNNVANWQSDKFYTHL